MTTSIFDEKTSEWLKKRPNVQTTVVKCDRCGKFYKPFLGHKCKEKGGTKNA